jgi:hypothetical protein
VNLRFKSLRRSPGALACALLVTIGGCAQVLGIQDWQDPLATSSSGSSVTSGGSGGMGGSGGEGTLSTSSASTTTGVSTTTTATSSSVGSMAVGSGAGGGDVSCADGILNLDESDIDCGGSCILCAYDRKCNNAGDCASGNCDMGRCGAPHTGCQPIGPDPTCADCLQNGDETDVDCGGVCSPCHFDKMCTNDGECWSAKCVGGRCAVGSAGKPCGDAQDCASAQCVPGNCVQLGACCM